MNPPQPLPKDSTPTLVESLLAHKEALALEMARRVEAETKLAANEERLRQAQKMEAVGRLAGGVAHDFNNLLTAILGYAGLIQTEAAPASSAFLHAQEIIKAGEHAGCLTHQLLAFSRDQAIEARTLDLDVLVQSMQSMLRRLIGDVVDLQMTPADAPLWLKADPTQLQQIVFNLAINARDAMPLGGRLTINSGRCPVSETNSLGLAPGPYVTLSFTDEGTGIPADVIDHIFEPFFTTKALGSGTGLGLATVSGIVQHTGGAIRVESELGAGTTFTVYLPATDPHQEEQDTPGDSSPLEARPGKVLVVEDDEIVRHLVCRVLEQGGYEVLSAVDGEEALAFGEERLRGLDLVLTDVVMPRVGGVELGRRLRLHQPGLPVVLMSGYCHTDLQKFSEIDEGADVLKKPFGPDVLSRRVREALDQPERRATGS